jgi:hypothetical protein
MPMHDTDRQETWEQEGNRVNAASFQKDLSSRIDTATLCPYELIEIGPGHLGKGSDSLEWI